MQRDGETGVGERRAAFSGNLAADRPPAPEAPAPEVPTVEASVAQAPAAGTPTVAAPAGEAPAPAGVPGGARAGAGAVVLGVVRTMRPRQWVKNLLVFAAPLASGRVFEGEVLGATLVAVGLFCLVSSGVYLVNDVRDAEEDRRHPRKRFRPVAAGTVPSSLALLVGGVLLAGALTCAVLLTRPQLAAVLGTYVAVSVAYSFFLKDQPVIDLAVVASGFLLRGVAGGAAAGIALSQWFLLVAAFGALFMVAGKRYAELVALGDAASTRRSLTEYSPSYLRFVWSLSAGVTCTAYSLWAFELRELDGGFPWQTISIAPFVLALLRYAVDVDRGTADAPEEIVLRDPVLLLLGLVWAGLVALGVFTG
ncbi:decaprenyl-phosphate phosphoribosyltransferase [Geodermatophilus sp. YIM 151500]|uniref:decaprenyl-phosphate phosphoribosyltransferase n=1 Tax=Geodermatophilus sp. YIM 151500 TaxID=2984531 RepID=UPI0021E3AEAA|nr:decaprenyl-phosphate phosphoribosyltransferase [Geodermatophilus sp. YIM 151500]MCV2488563.1 decaprenyl-phosphate phosphoribosyltransferase [Geodermatophilus sp. YIM 151500]